jgi:cholinesterase
LISQSGTATAFFDPPAKNNTVPWFKASVALGCGDASVGAEASLECMRKASVAQILNATTVDDPLKAVLGNFGPTQDGEVVFSNYDDLARQGEFIHKPFLVGNNDYEAGLFWLFATAANRNFTDLEWCLFNADIFTCPTAKAAAFRHQNGVKTYRYRYYGEFYNLRLTSNPSSGTWHGSEIPIIFQAAEDASGVPNTPAENSIGDYLQKAWADFAKNPDFAFSYAPYFYPEYDPIGEFITSPPSIQCRCKLTQINTGPTLIQYAQNNETQPRFTLPITTDSLCPALEFLDSVIPGGIIGELTSGDIDSVLRIAREEAKTSGRADVQKLVKIMDGTDRGSTDANQRCPF